MRYNRMQLEKKFVWKKFCIGNRNCMVECMVRIAGIVGSLGVGVYGLKCVTIEGNWKRNSFRRNFVLEIGIVWQNVWLELQEL